MGRREVRPLSVAGLALLLGAMACPVLADAPQALLFPDQYRESIVPDNLRALGFTPEQYSFEIPLGGSIAVQHQYVRAGDTTMFSLGMTEHTTDTLRFQFNKRGSLQFGQDQASTTGLYDTLDTLSRKRTFNLTQAFGPGGTGGNLTLAHEDSYTEDRIAGFSRSQSDNAGITLALGKTLGFTGSGGIASSLAQIDTNTKTISAAVSRTGSTDPALAEFHYTSSQVGPWVTDTTQGILRTPTVKVGEVTTSASASQTHTEVGGVFDQTANALALTSQVGKQVTVSGSHTATEVSAGSDSVADTVGSQIRLLPDTTLSASYNETNTEGVGLSSTRSVEVAKTPLDGRGLGLRAAYADLNLPHQADVDPTVHVQVDYADAKAWGFHGRYHDEYTRPKPEVAAGVQMPVLGGALKLDYSEYVLDPTTYIVQLSRVYSAEMTRSLGWGLNGRIAYQFSDSLAGDSAQGQAFQISLGGDSKVLGKIDLQFQQGFLRTPAGSSPTGSNFTLSFTRPLGSIGDVALSARHTQTAPGSGLPLTDDVMQFDLRTTW